MKNFARMALDEGMIGVAEFIRPLDPAELLKSAQHLDQLTKPRGSLGQLETLAAQMFAIRKGRVELPLSKPVYVFAADHGVAREGVSAYPPEVTAQMLKNFVSGGAAINILARQHGAELTVVDAGVDAEFEGTRGPRHGARVSILDASADPVQDSRSR
jgi:nicotinate-nucleotide--dimethylbenzimidazole phosphoribosyltransferase